MLVLVIGKMDVFIDHHQTISLRVWQSLQQNGIDHREDRGVGADSERQCEDDYRGESRIFAERADAIPQILPQPLNKRFPAGRADNFLRSYFKTLRKTIMKQAI